MKNFPLHTALTIVALAGMLLATPRWIPAVKAPAYDQVVTPLVQFDEQSTPLTPLVAAKVAEPMPTMAVRRRVTPTGPTLLDDDKGVLDRFYESLTRTERHQPGAVTRIVHYGDSPTTADLVTGDIRTQLQTRYGDAGQGFILIAKPWAWYQHHDADVTGSGWQMAPASRFESRDGLFGLGGVSFVGGSSAHSRFKWRDPSQSHFEIFFLQQPGGGTITVNAGDSTVARINTDGEAKAAAFSSFTVDGGATALDLSAQGNVRLFGLSAEKPGPGVIYDSLGLNGASITVISRMFQERHLADELRHRNPDLVIINYGTNEADFAAFVDGPYEKELRESIRRVHAAVPEASILLMSPMDRGHRSGPGEIETMETIPRIIAIQRRVARDTGCGFFDTFDAMGGAGTIARWYNNQPRMVSADLIHPYPAGGKQVATAFVRQIEAGLGRFKLR